MRKVGSFLNGFILVEVHRVARTTAADILDRLVTECVEGFNLILTTMTNIVSSSALTADAVTWSGLWEGMGRGFGGYPHGRWMMLWDLILGPVEALVLNDPSLWELEDLLL